MPHFSANWLCASTLTLLLLATSCNAVTEYQRQLKRASRNHGRRLMDHTIADSIQEPIDLGVGSDFAVLAASTATNTGPTAVGGMIGVYPGTAITGAGQMDFAVQPTFNGRALRGEEEAAHAAMSLAYTEAEGRLGNVTLIPVVNIGGTTYTPGLYKTTAALAISSGTLYLHGKGIYIFQIASTLTVANGMQMVLQGGAEASDVFWQVGSSATFGIGSKVKGTVMAYASITMVTGASIHGRLFAKTAAITMDSNTITYPFNMTELAELALSSMRESQAATAMFNQGINENLQSNGLAPSSV
jgi:hypothetical protein